MNLAGLTTCTPCPSGTYSDQAGEVESSDAMENRIAAFCAPLASCKRPQAAPQLPPSLPLLPLRFPSHTFGPSWPQAPPIAPGRPALAEPTATPVCSAQNRARLRGILVVCEAEAERNMHRHEARDGQAILRRRDGWPMGQSKLTRGRSDDFNGSGLHAVLGRDLLRCRRCVSTNIGDCCS